jgi:demethylmenaquinone methyltransferase/2-methoxy-6-polyprenyl-1,4-benzoquinol methylase
MPVTMTPSPPSSSTAIWSATDLAGDPHRVSDKAERVQCMFASIAHRYDLNNRIHSFGQDLRWRRRAVELAAVGPGDRVLDAACGTGDLAELFAEAGAAEVLGVDFTEAMLEIARRRAARRTGHGAGALQYLRADVMALPLPHESFDVAAIAFGLRNLGDPVVGLSELSRILRPGGRLLILEFSQPTNRVLRWLNRLYCGRILPVTAGLLSGDRVGAYRYLPRSVETFQSPSDLAVLLRGLGFTDIRIRPLTFGVCTAIAALRGGKNSGRPPE